MLERDAALALFVEHNPDPQQMKHALASEAVLRALARHFGENEEIWGLAGLLHDVDYARTKDKPEDHGRLAVPILEGKLPADAVAAIQAHNSECTGLAPASRLDFALRAGETITGLITAAALMRPTGMEGREVKSVKKKLKDKAFAANVSRDRIRECERIDLPLDDFLGLAIKAMTPQA